MINHRYQLGRRLDRNPKLGSAGELAKMVPAAWKVARDLAVDGMHEHGEDVSAIPEECPYDLGQIRGDKRYPANRHGIPD